jgi:hypothetical protein
MTTGLFGDISPKAGAAEAKGSPLPDDVFAVIAAGRKALDEAERDAKRATIIRRWETEILEGAPEIATWLQNDFHIDQLAARREATRKSYARRFALFARWAAERGFDAMPYPAACVAFFFIEETNRGVPVSEVKLARSAIEATHLQAGHAPPCRDPLVKAVIRFICTRPNDGGDGGKPVQMHKKAA